MAFIVQSADPNEPEPRTWVTACDCDEHGNDWELVFEDEPIAQAFISRVKAGRDAKRYGLHKRLWRIVPRGE